MRNHQDKLLSCQDIADIMTARGYPMSKFAVKSHTLSAMKKFKRAFMEDPNFKDLLQDIGIEQPSTDYWDQLLIALQE